MAHIQSVNENAADYLEEVATASHTVLNYTKQDIPYPTTSLARITRGL